MRPITPRRRADLSILADSKSPRVSVFAADVRILLDAREYVLRARAEDLTPESSASLQRLANGAKTTSAQIQLSPADLRQLLAIYAERGAHLAACAAEQAQEQAAQETAGAREIQIREGGVRRHALVGPNHGAERASVRAYAFDTNHLAGFLELHPETVRAAIRNGDLVPTDLHSIAAYKQRTEKVRRDGEPEQVDVEIGGMKLPISKGGTS